MNLFHVVVVHLVVLDAVDALNQEQVDLCRVRWLIVSVGVVCFTPRRPLYIDRSVLLLAELHFGFVGKP